MRSYRSGAKKILILTSLLTGLSLASCGMAQGSLHAIAVTTNASAPTAVEGSTTPSDTTAPIIDALNVTIPYGTFLRLADIATITDDQDAFPTLEIVSVSNMDEKPSQKTDVSKEGSTLPLAGTTASTSATALEAAEVEPDVYSGTEETSFGSTKNASSTGSTGNAAATGSTENVIAGSTGNAAAAGSTGNAAAAGSTGNTTSVRSTENAAAAITSETAAEVEPTEPGYLFNEPGKFSMLLKGTDKSGNESTKTIIVTVKDNVTPVFDGLRESFEITDKDKTAPDYLEGIKATDEIDGDVTAAIKVDDSKVTYGKPGSYSIAYSVSDMTGNTATANSPVIIKDTTAPYLSVISSAFNLFVTDEKPNYASSVTAIDSVDGDVKDTLTVDDSAVNYKYPGKYTANFRVQDKSGNTSEKSVSISISAGWKTQNGKTFYYSPVDGHLYHSWSQIDNKNYYFDPDDGHMLKGMQTVDGRQYLLDENDGHMITGWQKTQGKTYYFSPDDGHMYHDWSSIDGKDYYFDHSEGNLLTGSQTIDGRQYLLDDKDGHMITGWQSINGKTYYYSPNDGHMYHDWSTIDGSEYYFDKSDGQMYTGTHYVDGVEYNFGTTGVATKVAQQTRSNSSDTRSYSGYAYIGNSNSRKFHKASCSSVRDMRDYNKVGFDSRSEAIDAGYTPCKRCHP